MKTVTSLAVAALVVVTLSLTSCQTGNQHLTVLSDLALRFHLEEPVDSAICAQFGELYDDTQSTMNEVRSLEKGIGICCCPCDEEEQQPREETSLKHDNCPCPDAIQWRFIAPVDTVSEMSLRGPEDNVYKFESRPWEKNERYEVFSLPQGTQLKRGEYRLNFRGTFLSDGVEREYSIPLLIDEKPYWAPRRR